MRAKIKEIYSLELTCSLEDYWPSDEQNFGISIRLIIGSVDITGGDIFDLFVCTPDWIKGQYTDVGPVWGRHMLIVMEYDWPLIRKKIDLLVTKCSGRDWQEISQKLSMFIAWEFDDYHA